MAVLAVLIVIAVVNSDNRYIQAIIALVVVAAVINFVQLLGR